jgi:hypothetical protein
VKWRTTNRKEWYSAKTSKWARIRPCSTFQSVKNRLSSATIQRNPLNFDADVTPCLKASAQVINHFLVNSRSSCPRSPRKVRPRRQTANVFISLAKIKLLNEDNSRQGVSRSMEQLCGSSKVFIATIIWQERMVTRNSRVSEFEMIAVMPPTILKDQRKTNFSQVMIESSQKLDQNEGNTLSFGSSEWFFQTGFASPLVLNNEIFKFPVLRSFKFVSFFKSTLSSPGWLIVRTV